MVKAGGPGMVYQPGEIVVENWPLDSFSDKLIAKRKPFVQLLMNLNSIRFIKGLDHNNAQ